MTITHCSISYLTICVAKLDLEPLSSLTVSFFLSPMLTPRQVLWTSSCLLSYPFFPISLKTPPTNPLEPAPGLLKQSYQVDSHPSHPLKSPFDKTEVPKTSRRADHCLAWNNLNCLHPHTKFSHLYLTLKASANEFLHLYFHLLSLQHFFAFIILLNLLIY